MRDDDGVTKVDEKAVVPEMGGEARERLARALDREHVVAAMLFGSQASGRPGPLSDIDVAVWLDPSLPAERRHGLRSDLLRAAMDALGTDEVDVVVLNAAPPLLRHRALKGGALLVDRDPRTRVGLETAALLEYFDTAPLRQTLAAGRRKRIAEGRFGRR